VVDGCDGFAGCGVVADVPKPLKGVAEAAGVLEKRILLCCCEELVGVEAPPDRFVVAPVPKPLLGCCEPPPKRLLVGAEPEAGVDVVLLFAPPNRLPGLVPDVVAFWFAADPNRFPEAPPPEVAVGLAKEKMFAAEEAGVCCWLPNMLPPVVPDVPPNSGFCCCPLISTDLSLATPFGSFEKALSPLLPTYGTTSGDFLATGALSSARTASWFC